MPFTKNGHIELAGVSVPSVVLPHGQVFEVKVLVRNYQATPPLADDDRCKEATSACVLDGSLQDDGFCVNVQMWVDGADPSSRNECIQFPVPGTQTQAQYTFQAVSPTADGQHGVNAKVNMTATDQATETIQNTITVDSDATLDPEHVDGNGVVKTPDFNIPGGGGGGGGGGSFLDNPATLAIALGFGVVAIDSALDD